MRTVGDFVEGEEEMAMESESARRGLGEEGQHISYYALRRNIVPCPQGGVSYYNCNNMAQVNPYRRECNAITRCARVLT